MESARLEIGKTTDQVAELEKRQDLTKIDVTGHDEFSHGHLERGYFYRRLQTTRILTNTTKRTVAISVISGCNIAVISPRTVPTFSNQRCMDYYK